MTNIKRDMINKVLSLLYCYNIVCFHDDNIKGWKDGHFSKSVHYSAVGTIKRRLSDSLRVPAVVLGNNILTTKTCSKCGNIQNMVFRIGFSSVRTAGWKSTRISILR